MSPLQIEIMLHYHCKVGAWGKGNCQFVSDLADMGMLEDRGVERDYEITEKGTAFVNKICSTPIPVETTAYIFPEE